MCVTFLLLDSHPDLRFLLAFNRDEYLERPTQPAHWWPDQPNLLASKDLKGGGTWLGLTREGRFALVTNVREVDHDKVTNAASRGALPIAFLTGKQIPMAFLGSIQLQAYNGFNMVVGDLSTKQAAYVTNRGTNTQPVQLQPGLHGISNGSGPQQEWFKVQRGKSILQDILNLDLPSSPSQPPLPSSTRRCRAEDHAGRMISEHARDPCLDTQAQQASRQEDPQLADVGNSPSKGIRSCQKRTLGKHEPQEDTARPSNCSAQQGAESRSPDLLDKQALGNTLMSIAVKPDHSGDLSHSAGNQQASGCSDSATRHPSPCDQALTDKASSSSVQTAACQHQEHARCHDPGSLPWDAIFKKLMQDRSSITDDLQLPATGMPQQMERMLSPIFIKTHTMLGVPYGTRTQTVIAAWHDGHVAMRERNLASNGAWVQAEHMFRLPLT